MGETVTSPQNLSKDIYSVPAAALWSTLFVVGDGIQSAVPVALTVISVSIYVFQSALVFLLTYETDASLVLFRLT